MSGKQLSAEYLHQMVVNALMAHNTSEENANSVAEALIYAEMNGLTGHGLSRLPSYCAQAASGKVDGHAVPEAYRVAEAAIRIDARFGFAFKALALAVDNLCNLAPKTGIAVAAITHSHHCGAAGYHVEALARKGLVGLMVFQHTDGNSPLGRKNRRIRYEPHCLCCAEERKRPFDHRSLSHGQFQSRLEDLIEEILCQENTRLPGDRRLELREKAHLNGIRLTDKQYQEIISLGSP